MKIGIDIKGLDAAQANLRGLADSKIKAAAKAALNTAAYQGAEATKKEMAQVFDRPTPWVLGGVRYKKATIEKLEASIDFDKWGNKTNVTVAHVLNAEIYGGQRRHKRHEIALQRAGILPSGMGIVPGKAAQLDAYGNMKGGQIVQIMSWFGSFGEQGYRANSTDKTRARLGRDKRNGQKGFQYFVLQKSYGKLQPGIYQRFQFGHGSAVKPVMIFVKLPWYKKRLDFYGVAEKAAREAFGPAFRGYLDQMLKERGL